MARSGTPAEEHLRAEASSGNPGCPSAFALLRAAFAPDLPLAVVTTICGAALSLTVAVYAYLAGPLLGIVFHGAEAGQELPAWISHAFHNFPGETQITAKALIAVLIATALVRGGLRYVQPLLVTRLHQRVARRLRGSVLSHLLDTSPLALSTQASGNLARLLGHDIQVVGQAVQTACGTLLLHALRSLVLLGAALHMQPRLAWLLFVALPVAALWLRWRSGRARRAWRAVYDIHGDLGTDVASVFSMIPTFQLAGRQDAARAHFTRRMHQLENAVVHAARVEALTAPVVQAVGALAVGAVLWLGAAGGGLGGARAISLVSFATATVLLFRSAQTLASRSLQLSNGAAALDRIQMLLALPARPAGGAPIPNQPLPLRLRGVGFAYGGAHVLSGIDLDIRPGESIAVVGPNGEGKTTLLRLVAGLLEGHSGRVTLGGTELSQADLASWQRHFGWVDQHPKLLPDTVEANVTLWDPAPDRERLQRALRQAGATALVQRLPHGYHTRLSEQGAPLSGGEQQRLCIARALYQQPRFLLLDEPSAALDATSERELADAIEQLLSSTTTVIVSHRLSTIARARRVVVLAQGRIVEQGQPDMLWRAGGAFRQLFDGQRWPVHDQRESHAETG